MEQNYTENQTRIKAQFCAERGAWKWNDTWETILELNEDILSAYSSLSSVAHKKGHLDQKTIGMIYVAIDASITHLYTPGLGSHLRHGVKDLGITKEEFLEVLAITSTVGASTYLAGIPALTGVLRRHGDDISAQGLTKAQQSLKEAFLAEQGFWNDEWDDILKLDEDMFACYLAYIGASLRKTVLSPKIRELIYIAVNAAPTTLNTERVERHMEKALAYGATKEELLEVLELVCCLGIHSVTVGLPLLNKALSGE